MMTPEAIREAAEAIAEMRKPNQTRRLSQKELAQLRPRMRELDEQQEQRRLEQGDADNLPVSFTIPYSK